MPNRSFLTIWLKNLRIQSFAISVCPVILATAMAFGDGIHDFKKAFVCLIVIVCIQILANMFKAYFHYKFIFEDILSLIVLGPVTVAATYYYQSNEMNYAIILSGISIGLISSAIVALNNTKDIEKDRSGHIQTLATMLGKQTSCLIYAFLIASGLILPTIICLLISDHTYIILTSTLMLLCIPAFKDVFSSSAPAAFNSAIVLSETTLILFTIIFSVGWII